MLALFIVALSGCATHPNITMPAVSPVNDPAFSHKSISYNILYSQPEPGMFMAGGEQMALKPLDQAKLSVVSAATLADLPQYIAGQLPANAIQAQAGQGDYQLTVKLVAHDKKGPAYGDMKFGESFVKS